MYEFFDGFEDGHYGLWDQMSTTPPAIVTGITGMDGTYAINCPNRFLTKTLTARSYYYISFLLRPGVSGVGLYLCQFWNAAGVKLGSLVRTSGNKLAFQRGDYAFPTPLVEGTATVSTDTYRIEIYYYPNGASGKIQVKVNGILDINYSGQVEGSGTAQHIAYFRVGNTCSATNCYFDNFIFDKDDWVGDVKIQKSIVTADVAGWKNMTTFPTPDQDHYAQVDEIPYNDTDGLYCTDLKWDKFEVSDMAGSIASVKAVQVQGRAKYEGGAMGCRFSITDTGGTQILPSIMDLESSYKTMYAVFNYDSQSNAWTKDKIDNMQIGVLGIVL